MKGITVAELIAQLRIFPPDAPVIVEGCDCMGECVGAKMMKWDDNRQAVLLAREDGPSQYWDETDTEEPTNG